MNLDAPRSARRSVAIGLLGIVLVALSACTGRGGGQLPPDGLVFKGAASFGFSFSCERSSASTSTNPPAGRLRIQLSYTDHGTNPLGSGFSVHGTVDTLDPVLESVVCIGQNPPPGGNELIFLGRYRTTTSGPGGLAHVVRQRYASVSLRGHRQGQRPEPRPVARRLLPDHAVQRHCTHLGAGPGNRVLHPGRHSAERGNLTVD